MKVEMQMKWISAEDFKNSNPIPATIAGVSEQRRGEKVDLQLLFCPDGTLDNVLRMSIYGENLNRLIKKLGNDTDLWHGKKIQILREANVNGKELKKIFPI